MQELEFIWNYKPEDSYKYIQTENMLDFFRVFLTYAAVKSDFA